MNIIIYYVLHIIKLLELYHIETHAIISMVYFEWSKRNISKRCFKRVRLK